MKNFVFWSSLLGAGLISWQANALIIDFDITGRMSYTANGDLQVFQDQTGGSHPDGQTFVPLSSTLSYDTVLGLGGSGISITALAPELTFHDITMTRQGNTNLITGQFLVDEASSMGTYPLHIEWDGTGLFNAITYGLSVGDVLSGTTLYHDTNSNGIEDAGEFLTNISSATPYSDTLQQSYSGTAFSSLAGPAPLAATSDSTGITLFTEIAAPDLEAILYLEIGSGNSMTVTSISPSTVVPIPATVWLFGSGLIGLVGLARRK